MQFSFKVAQDFFLDKMFNEKLVSNPNGNKNYTINAHVAI